MSLYIPVPGKANPTLWANSMTALDLVNERAYGFGVVSGLTVDSSGYLQPGEAMIGHIVFVPLAVNIRPKLQPSATNYLFLQRPAMPATIPALGPSAGVVGADGRDEGVVDANQTGLLPAGAALLAVIVTGAGGSITSINNAPTGRASVVLPAQIGATLGKLQVKSGFVSGPLPVEANITAIRVWTPLTWLQIKASVLTAPLGAAQIFDVKKNGVSLHASAAGRLSIPAGAAAGASAAFDTGAACVEGDIITIDVTQAGTTPAQGFLPSLIYKL